MAGGLDGADACGACWWVGGLAGGAAGCLADCEDGGLCGGEAGAERGDDGCGGRLDGGGVRDGDGRSGAGAAGGSAAPPPPVALSVTSTALLDLRVDSLAAATPLLLGDSIAASLVAVTDGEVEGASGASFCLGAAADATGPLASSRRPPPLARLSPSRTADDDAALFSAAPMGEPGGVSLCWAAADPCVRSPGVRSPCVRSPCVRSPCVRSP